jgi:hypothetical protein
MRLVHRCTLAHRSPLGKLRFWSVLRNLRLRSGSLGFEASVVDRILHRCHLILERHGRGFALGCGSLEVLGNLRAEYSRITAVGGRLCASRAAQACQQAFLRAGPPRRSQNRDDQRRHPGAGRVELPEPVGQQRLISSREQEGREDEIGHAPCDGLERELG